MVSTKNLTSEVIQERLLKNKLNKLNHKLERELIQSFRIFSAQIEERIRSIDDSPQLLNIIKIGDAFREVCEKIGEDKDHFRTFTRFLDEVRRKDRDMDYLIEAYKRKYDFNNPEKFRVEKTVLVDDILMHYQSLRSIFEDYQAQKEEMQENYKKSSINLRENTHQPKNTISARFSDLISDLRQSIQKITNLSPEKLQSMDENRFTTQLLSRTYYLKYPEQEEEMQKKIENFRKASTPEILASIISPLPFQMERKCLIRHIKFLIDKLQEFETQGFIEHINQFLSMIYSHLEDIGEKIDNEQQFNFTFKKIMHLKEIIRKCYRHLEDWQERVNRKYKNQANSDNKNDTEPLVNKKILDEYISSYRQEREKLRIMYENRCIYRYLKSEETRLAKIKQNNQREKQKNQEIDKNGEENIEKKREK